MNNERVSYLCATCGKVFETSVIHWSEKSTMVFCSPQCCSDALYLLRERRKETANTRAEERREAIKHAAQKLITELLTDMEIRG